MNLLDWLNSFKHQDFYRKLTEVKRLDLAGHGISSLHPDFHKLKLTHLDLRYNHLIEFSYNSRCLRGLKLCNNPLKTLNLNAPNISKLYINETHLTELNLSLERLKTVLADRNYYLTKVNIDCPKLRQFQLLDTGKNKKGVVVQEFSLDHWVRGFYSNKRIILDVKQSFERDFLEDRSHVEVMIQEKSLCSSL